MTDIFGNKFSSGVWFCPKTNNLFLIQFDRTGISVSTDSKFEIGPTKLKHILLKGAELMGFVFVGDF